MDYLSLFSGVGGLEYGIQQSNKKELLNCIGFSEIDANAINIYRKHFPTHTPMGDVREIRTNELPDFDLLVGGFPCQSFSNAGNKQGFCDTRGTLFFEIERILKDKRPRYFLLENVRGLLSNDSGKTFKTILKILVKMGYSIEWELLNSENFGVPQRRERVFIRGHLGEGSAREILSFRTNYERPNYHIKEENKPVMYKIKETTKKGYKEARMFDGVLLNRTNRKKMKGMVQKNKIGTLATSINWGVVDHTGRIRRLTPLECERVQGFPDYWTSVGFDGTVMKDTHRYKMMGNAVTTNVITHIFNNWDLKLN